MSRNYGYIFGVATAPLDLDHLDDDFDIEDDDSLYEYHLNDSLPPSSPPQAWQDDVSSGIGQDEHNLDDDQLSDAYDTPLPFGLELSGGGNFDLDLARGQYYYGNDGNDSDRGSIDENSSGSVIHSDSLQPEVQTADEDEDDGEEEETEEEGEEEEEDEEEQEAVVGDDVEEAEEEEDDDDDIDDEIDQDNEDEDEPPSLGSASSSQPSQYNPDLIPPSNSNSQVTTSSASTSSQVWDPHRRNRRQLPDPFDMNARASPRRPSLTPDIHPNRRLPRNLYPHNHQSNPPLAGPSGRRRGSRHVQNSPLQIIDDSSADELNDRPALRHSSQLPSSQQLDDAALDSFNDNEDSISPVESNSPAFGQPLDQVDLDQLEAENPSMLPLQRERLRHIRAERVAVAARIARGEINLARPERLPIYWGAGVDLGADMDGDDELVEVVYRQVTAPPPPPQQQQQQQQQQARHNRQHVHQNNNNNSSNNNNQAGAVDVIDLTEEPDSPVLHINRPINLPRNNHRHHHHHNHIHLDDDLHAAQHRHRNPRRQMSQPNGRTPSLARSDGSILGNAPPVIDLTSDSPVGEEAERENIPANRRLPAPVPQQPQQQQQQRHNRRSVEFIGIGRGAANFIENIRGFFPAIPGIIAHIANPRDDVQIIGDHPIFPMNPNPLAGNPPEFNYQANGFGGFGGRQPTPKPDFEAPPPARPGFTRDTGNNRETDEEQVFVCPSCDNELKYSANDDDDNPRPTKRARTKKEREEHHFWAVKACGHVYCKNCYDNRKKTKGKEVANLGFRFEQSSSNKTTKTFCAVDNCDSDVTSTNAWIGIFM